MFSVSFTRSSKVKLDLERLNSSSEHTFGFFSAAGPAGSESTSGVDGCWTCSGAYAPEDWGSVAGSETSTCWTSLFSGFPDPGSVLVPPPVSSVRLPFAPDPTLGTAYVLAFLTWTVF